MEEEDSISFAERFFGVALEGVFGDALVLLAFGFAGVAFAGVVGMINPAAPVLWTSMRWDIALAVTPSEKLVWEG